MSNEIEKIPFSLVLGYDTAGAVARSVRQVKGCALIPLVVLNSEGGDYSAVLPKNLILKSASVNRDHRLLGKEIESAIRSYLHGAEGFIASMINFQDRMWLCYLDLLREFPNAVAFTADVIARTAIKPNFRFLMKGTPYEVAHLLVHESVMRQPNPFSYQPLAHLARQHDRLIVKPLVGTAGQGVKRVSSEDLPAISNAVENVLALQKSIYSDTILCPLEAYDGPQPVNQYVLLEEYISGTEYSVEGAADDIGAPTDLVIQEKTRQEESPVFRDMEYVAVHPYPTNSDVVRAITDILQLTGFRGFPFHIELKLTHDGKWKPIEFNPRMGGGSIMDLVTIVHGVDLQGIALSSILRRVPSSRALVTTVLQPEPGATGRVVEYQGLREIEQAPDCVFVKKIVPEGRIIKDTDREIYLAEFCVAGRDRAIARQRAAELLASIHVVMQQDSDSIGECN